MTKLTLTCQKIKSGATVDQTYMTLVTKTCAVQMNKYEKRFKVQNEQIKKKQMNKMIKWMKKFVLVMTKSLHACSRSAGGVDSVTDRKAMPWAQRQLNPEHLDACNRLCRTPAQRAL